MSHLIHLRICAHRDEHIPDLWCENPMIAGRSLAIGFFPLFLMRLIELRMMLRDLTPKDVRLSIKAIDFDGIM